MIDQRQIDDFEKHGVICLRGYFNNWVDVLREGIEKLIRNPSPRERSYVPEDGSAPFFQDLCNWQRIQEFEDLLTQTHGRLAGRRSMRSGDYELARREAEFKSKMRRKRFVAHY